jgi:integrase
MIVEKEALLSQREQLIAEKEALLAERDRLIAVRDAELYSKTLQIEHLKAQLAVLRRARFGRSSEKLDRDIEQLELLIGELEEGVAENKIGVEQAEDKARAISTRAKPSDHQAGGRKPLPALDSAQKIIRVEQSKGRKDRNVMLSPEMLALLRQWWKVRPSRYDGETPVQERWLFPAARAGESASR